MGVSLSHSAPWTASHGELEAAGRSRRFSDEPCRPHPGRSDLTRTDRRRAFHKTPCVPSRPGGASGEASSAVFPHLDEAVQIRAVKEQFPEFPPRRERHPHPDVRRKGIEVDLPIPGYFRCHPPFCGTLFPVPPSIRPRSIERFPQYPRLVSSGAAWPRRGAGGASTPVQPPGVRSPPAR